MMKRVLIMLMLLAVSGSLFGAVFAVDGGSVYFSGEAYYEKGFGDAFDSDVILFAPGFHWFIMKRLSVGVDLHLEHASSGSQDYDSFSGYAMVNYFMGRKSGFVFPYVGAGFGAGKRSYGAVDYKFSGLKINAGVCFLLNDYIGIKTIASYTLDSVTSEFYSSSKNGGRLRIGVGIALFIF